MRSQFRGDQSRFSDRYRSRHDRSRCARSQSFDRYRSYRQRACSLPAGEIGVTASGHTLSRVALVTTSGHAGDYLPLLSARLEEPGRLARQKCRRVLRQLSLSLLLFLKCRWQFLLRQEVLFLSSLPSVMQDLTRFFFEPVKILFPGSGLRCCGHGCAVCWVWVQLCPSTSAAGAVALGAATAMPAGAGDPPAAGCCVWRSWAYAASGGFPLSWASASLAQWWVRLARSVTGGGFLRLCFLLVVLKVLPVFLGFSRLWIRFSSAHFWSLLHWRRLRVVLPASAVDCCLSSLRAGVCSLLWQWRISARVLMVACLPLLRVGGTAPSPVPLMLVALTGFPVNHGLF